MSTDWAVTTATDRFALDSTGSADVIFTVTNRAQVNERAVLDVVVEAPTDKSWFTVEEPQRLITAGASVPFRVKIAVPPGAPAGSHFLKALVYSADSAPEETARYSNRLAFEVKPVEQPKQRWWIAVLIGAVVLAVVLGVVGYLVLRPTPAPPTNGQGARSSSVSASPAGPDVTNLQRAHVRSAGVGAGQNADAVANCPAGTVVIGGGYWLRSPVGIIIDVSRPAASGQGWHVHGFNPTSSSFDFDVDVVCGTVRDQQIVNASSTVPGGQAGNAVATCPPGKVSTGGGGSALGSFVTIETSRPATSTQGWEVHAVNQAADARTITAHAVCATAPSRVVVTTSTTVHTQARSESIVDCPAGTVGTGGGYRFSPTGGLHIYLSTPASGQGWDVRAENRAGADRTVTAYAVCASGG